MKKLISLLALVALTAGCKSVKISPAIVQSGVTASVMYGVTKYPSAIPAIRISEQVICSAANGTNLSPAAVVAAIEASEWEKAKTPEAVFILNGVIMIYSSAWNSYGNDAINNAPVFKEYLKAVCSGVHDGLPLTVARSIDPTQNPKWPLLQFK